MLSKSVTARFALLCLAGVAAAPLGCNGASDEHALPPDSASGSIGLSLDVAPGTTLTSVSYTIIGPAGFAKSDSIDVSDSTTLTATISPIPAGTGFSITLNAASSNQTTCSGSASFDVVAHQTTPVAVHLLCHETVHTGSVLLNGSLNICPVLDGIAVNPTQVFVGGSLALDATAHDSDQEPASLSYRWTATSGTFSDASARNPNFSCAAVGSATLTLVVSDGDPTVACADTGSVTVDCLAPDTSGGAGAGGALNGGAGAGGGGTSGAAGTSAGGNAGIAGSGGAAGSSGGGALPDDLVVYRVGDGASALVATGNPVFLDELSQSGAAVRSIALPTTATGANHRLVASGTATSEGFITRSSDAKYLVLTGYDATIPVSGGVPGTASSAVPRTIARVDAAGNVDTTTALPDAASGSNPRSAASTNGLDFWFAGAAGGARYVTLGSSSSVQLSTTVVNLRQLQIFGSQLFVSDSSGSAVRLGAVGAGVPMVAGQTIVNLPGIPAASGSPYGFFFADLDAGTPGLDTLYVADDSLGLTKYSLVAGTWTSNGTLGSASDAYRGLTGVVSGQSVSLFATRKGGSAAVGGGELVSVVDSSGYNQTLSAAASLLATSGSNTAYRGVALAPRP